MTDWRGRALSSFRAGGKQVPTCTALLLVERGGAGGVSAIRWRWMGTGAMYGTVTVTALSTGQHPTRVCPRLSGKGQGYCGRQQAYRGTKGTAQQEGADPANHPEDRGSGYCKVLCEVYSTVYGRTQKAKRTDCSTALCSILYRAIPCSTLYCTVFWALVLVGRVPWEQYRTTALKRRQ